MNEHAQFYYDGNTYSQPVIPTESSDSDQPHVHKLSEAHQWWADAFPQHTKENPNG
jgi:hypothetical protein